MFTTPPVVTRLLVDAMLPDLLLSSRRVCARAQDRLHLLNASEHDLPSNKPPDTLVAGRAGQAALICPELVKVLDRLHGECEVHLDGLLNLHLIEPDHGRELVEESVVEVTRVQTEGKNSTLMALSVDVDEMHLSLAAIPSD